VIRGNVSERNRRDGIRVDASSTGNLIQNNQLRNNGEHDAHDDSVGSRTGGTANTWTGNSGQTENVTGLLTHPHRQPGHGHDHDHDHDHDDDHDHDHDDDHGHGHDD